MSEKDIAAENQKESLELETPEEETSAIKDVESFRTDFSLPPKIKRIKIIIAVVTNFLLGGVTTSMAIYFFIKPQVENTTYNVVLAVFMLLFGGILFIQFPLIMARTINSRLILSGERIYLRNAFTWKSVPWVEVEEILAREKLSKDLAESELLGVDLIRFRTLTAGIHFLAENYPAEDADEMLLAIARTFENILEGTEFEVEEKTERPSIQTRLRYFIKRSKK